MRRPALAALVVLFGAAICGLADAQPPLVRPSTAYISPSSQLTISGSFFSSSAASNAVSLSSGSCTVSFSSASTIICTFSTAPAFGPLYVNSVTSGGVTNAYNPKVQVANVSPAPTITAMMQPPIIIGRIQQLNISGTNFNGTDLAVELSSGAVYSKCLITSNNDSFIECRPEDDSGFEAGALFATVSTMGSIRSSPAAVATLLPMIEEPVGGNYSIGRPPVNVPSYHIGSTSVTFRGHYLSRSTSAYTIGFTLGAGKHLCIATAATARTVTCTPNPAIATLGPIIAQTNVTIATPFGSQTLPGIPNLAAFIIPRVDAPTTEIPTFVSALNVTAGTLNFTGVGFAPDKENNTVLLYPLEGAFNNDPPYLCETVTATATAITCTIPAYMIAGSYGASVISYLSPAGPAPPKLLNVTPVVLEANATSCCFEGKYTGVIIEGAGFSINETEQIVEINDPNLPGLTSCRPIEPTFPGLASIGNGKMACLLDYDLAAIEWIENVTVTVRGFKSNTFRIKGLKKELSDKQVLAISIVGPIVAAGLAALVAIFLILSGSRCRKNETVNDKYEPMVTTADPYAMRPEASAAAGASKKSPPPRIVEVYAAEQISSTSYKSNASAFAPPGGGLYAPEPQQGKRKSKRKSDRRPEPEPEPEPEQYEMPRYYPQVQQEEEEQEQHVVSPAVSPRQPPQLAPPTLPNKPAPPPAPRPALPPVPVPVPGPAPSSSSAYSASAQPASPRLFAPLPPVPGVPPKAPMKAPPKIPGPPPAPARPPAPF